MKPKIKIGIPRALLYHKYGLFWEDFFRRLGCEPVISPLTNKEILSRGTNLAIDESCLSVKIYLGHVDYLRERCDFVFVPRMATLRKKEELCSKFWGLYDVVNNTFDGISLLTCNIEHQRQEPREFVKLGMRLGKSPANALVAYMLAKKAQRRKNEHSRKEQETAISKRDQLRILVISHPYTTYDHFLGQPITKFLKDNHVQLLYPDKMDHNHARKRSNAVSTDLYWTYHKELLGAIEEYRDQVDGLLFLNTFPCGPDALFIDYCLKRYKSPPAVVLTLDEQLGDAGMKTRLESFVDILRMRGKAVKVGVACAE